LTRAEPARVARVFGDVVDDDGFAAAGGGAAEAGVQRDARVRSETAGEGSDEEDAGVGGIGEVEADPVELGDGGVEFLGDALHKRVGGGDGEGEFAKLLQEFFVHAR